MTKINLNNGTSIPPLGFGVYMVPDHNECKHAVLNALKEGYRLIDTAAVYQNERAVGETMKESGIPRGEIYLTTKIWIQDYGYEKTAAAIDGALERLQVDYIDLMLLHQPFADYLGSWKALEEAVDAGKLGSIGLSNFKTQKLQQVLDMARVRPVVNQVECHPYFQQKELKKLLKANQIELQAWYPIGHGSPELLGEKVLADLAKKHGKDTVQIILRWHLQEGNIALPKSTNPAHIRSNFDVFDFALSQEDMDAIRAMDRDASFFDMPEAEQEKTFTGLHVTY